MYKMMGGSFVLLLIMAGCGIPQGSWYKDELLLTRYETSIAHGKTTEQDIREWFGEPWVVTKDLQGRPQFIYFFRGERIRLDVVFNTAGIVVDHNITRDQLFAPE
jgi:hypothetical protein